MLVDGELAVGASACVDAAKGEQQAWALEMIEKGVQFNSSKDGSLTWKNGLDTLIFAAK